MATFRPHTDEFEPVSILMGLGAGHSVSGPDEDVPSVAGVLVIPDPEQRRGWRERYIYAEPKPGSERPPFGFRKP